MQKVLFYYPTVSWGSRKDERWSSSIHYDAGNGRTLCGRRIPSGRPSGDAWDMCESCVKIVERREAKDKESK